MSKIDLKKELKHLYTATKKFEIVEVPELNFLMIDGAGNPNKEQSFRDAIEALFGVSYALKFMLKKSPEAIDYSVMPLEGLWWTEPMEIFSLANKSNWLWTVMIMQPKWITASLVSEAIAKVVAKKQNPALNLLRFETFSEGKAAQVLYVGPYQNEAPTIQELHKFIAEKGYKLRGKHHEIYLSDMRKTAPEKLKTILRQPIA
jgi:hypothetical protein